MIEYLRNPNYGIKADRVMAKRLKEVGFNYPTKSYLSERSKKELMKFSDIQEFHNLREKNIAVPTIDLIIQWAEQEHGFNTDTYVEYKPQRYGARLTKADGTKFFIGALYDTRIPVKIACINKILDYLESLPKK